MRTLRHTSGNGRVCVPTGTTGENGDGGMVLISLFTAELGVPRFCAPLAIGVDKSLVGKVSVDLAVGVVGGAMSDSTNMRLLFAGATTVATSASSESKSITCSSLAVRERFVAEEVDLLFFFIEVSAL